MLTNFFHQHHLPMKTRLLLLPALLLSACHPSSPGDGDAVQADSEAPPTELTSLFDSQIVVKLHCFARPDDGMPEEYPYNGTPIPENLHPWLDSTMAGSGGSPVLGCYFLENDDSYVLRKGNTLLLARWNNDRQVLEKELDLSYRVCSAEGLCEMQDAWLIDLDDNRVLELVIRKQQRNPGGQLTLDVFQVFERSADKHFAEASPALVTLAPQDRYVMRY
ncbi:MAG: hypothetical protein RLY31_1974 [Bacteroidota bacterium]|jgi:hypothetical protein